MNKHLSTITDLVKSILEEKPDTRNSDELLYVEVLETYSDRMDVDVCNYPFASALKNLKAWGIPSMKTVERCRRKVQSDFPKLAANDTVEGFRAIKEQEVKRWAKETI